MNDETKPPRRRSDGDDTEPGDKTWIDPDLIDHGDNERVSRLLVESFPPVPPDPGVWTRVESAITTMPVEPSATSSGRSPRRWRPTRWQGLLSIAAVLMLIVGAVAVFSGGPGGEAVAEGVLRELADPSTGQVAMTLAIQPDGTSLADAVDLPSLPGDQTYQLWAVVGDEIVSVGLLGHDPVDVPLRIEGEPSVLALTVEVAGGVAVSQAQPVAVWQAAG
jgi:hypothetical protein